MNNQMTKRQHYVPQFYLNNFINENQKLNVYDRKKKCFLKLLPRRFVLRIIFMKHFGKMRILNWGNMFYRTKLKKIFLFRKALIVQFKKR